jgi:hypothetical protein
MNQKYIDRFWNKVIKTSSCWEWQAAKNKQGYGMYSVDGKSIPAHRFSAMLHGFIIDNKLVCHTCDNSKCVNPNHFFIGNYQDNVDDMIAKGRKKLNNKQIKTPDGIFESRLAAAKHYKVSAPAIGKRMLQNPSEYYYC